MAIAAEKYNGIMFTDMDDNILSEQFSDEYMADDNNQLQNQVETINEDTIEQPSQESKDAEAISGETAPTTADENDMDEMNDWTQDNNSPGDDFSDHSNNNTTGNNDETQEAIDHEDDSTDDDRITIDDINIVTQMNSSQMAIEEEEQE